MKIALKVSFGIYLFALAVILFMSSRGLGFAHELTLLEYIKYSSNFVPFKTINTYINALQDGTMNRDIPIKNLLGNFVLFLPMGIFLPILFKRLSIFKKYIITIILVLLSIEIIQVITRLGSFDIDDLLLNLLGAILGFSIYKLLVQLKIIRYDSNKNLT